MQLNPMLIIILILPIKPIKCLPALSAITQNFHLFHQVASHDLCIIRSGDCKYHIGPINLVGKDVVSLLNEKPLCNNYKVFLKVMRSPKRRSISEFTQQGGRRKRTAFKASVHQQNGEPTPNLCEAQSTWLPLEWNRLFFFNNIN